MKHRLIPCILAAAALLLGGCTITTLRSGEDSFTRIAFGANTQVANMTVRIRPSDGTREITIRGYDQEQSEAFAAAAEGITQAVLKAITPVPLP